MTSAAVDGDLFPFDFVVFGGAGDLALRKLMPALYYREASGRLAEDSRLIGLGRREMSDSAYADRVAAACRQHVPAADFSDGVWKGFGERLGYVSLDGSDASSYAGLAARLEGRQDKARVFYLAVAPDLYGPICICLRAAGLVTERSRVVLEKPIGYDLGSSRRVNDLVGSVFREEQIFRIDHYLGKETVQNLLVVRFANALFEPLWRSSRVDHVQITTAETLGAQGRMAYYDSSGALRDMIQNHMLQLLCLVAMEPPSRLEPNAIRDEKLKVLRALRPIEGAEVGTCAVRGQYRKGAVDGQAVAGYLEELHQEVGDERSSQTETFVALKAEVDNWRWAGVPFYLRTGKRMPVRCSDIVVQFRNVPHLLFSPAGAHIHPNRLVIRLQPDEGIKLHMMHKVPGPGTMQLRSAPLNVSFAETFNTRSPDAYERLLGDVVRGNPTLFMRRDEVDAAWSFVEPIRQGWSSSDEGPRGYTAGTWGPSAAIALIERDGRTWYEEIS